MSTKSKQHMGVLNEVQTMINRVKSLNEAMSFDEDYDIERDFVDDEEDTEYAPEMSEKPSVEPCRGEECDIDEPNDIDAIREIAIKGMLKYAKQSNSAEYETLKKILQFCDKVNNDKSGDDLEEK